MTLVGYFIATDLIEVLELEIEELTEKLAASEQRNAQLSDELNRLADEIIDVQVSWCVGHLKDFDNRAKGAMESSSWVFTHNSIRCDAMRCDAMRCDAMDFY